MEETKNDELLTQILASLKRIEDHLGIIAPEEENTDPRMTQVQLKGKLQLTGKKIRVLRKAIKKKYIRVRVDGTLEWHGEYVQSLAFLCGRLWSDDKMKGNLWRKGDRPFPAAPLENLFHVRNLKQLRQQGLDREITAEESAILNLFVD